MTSALDGVPVHKRNGNHVGIGKDGVGLQLSIVYVAEVRLRIVTNAVENEYSFLRGFAFFEVWILWRRIVKEVFWSVAEWRLVACSGQLLYKPRRILHHPLQAEMYHQTRRQTRPCRLARHRDPPCLPPMSLPLPWNHRPLRPLPGLP
jgi:hypothetical protein